MCVALPLILHLRKDVGNGTKITTVRGLVRAVLSSLQKLHRWVSTLCVAYSLTRMLSVLASAQKNRNFVPLIQWRVNRPVTAGLMRMGLQPFFRQFSLVQLWEPKSKKFVLSNAPKRPQNAKTKAYILTLYALSIIHIETRMNPEPNIKQAVAFFAVSNIEASVRYYVDGLGFEMTNKWIDEGKLRWCWLQRGGAALMLQEFRKEGHDSWVPEGKVGVGVSICFICEDALAIYREVTARGIQASKPFVGNGMWVTSLSDPDGYRIEFESYTDVPEETVYSGHEGD
jgi:catechol 2,3-dioxygenase-like lactoylglutathione lyase family enzyme